MGPAQYSSNLLLLVSSHRVARMFRHVRMKMQFGLDMRANGGGLRLL